MWLVVILTRPARKIHDRTWYDRIGHDRCWNYDQTMSTGFQHVTSFPTICRHTPCRPKISTLSPIWSSSSPFLAVESGKQGHGERKLSKPSSRKKKTAEMGHINHPYLKFMLGFTIFFLPPSFWYASIACYQPSHCSISSLWINQSMDCFKGPSTGTTYILWEKPWLYHGFPQILWEKPWKTHVFL